MKNLFSYKFTVPLSIFFAVAIVISGVFLEVSYADDHFSRSGALLVVLALTMAYFKERSSKKAELELIEKGQFLSKKQHEHYHAKCKQDITNLVAPLYERVINENNEKLDRLEKLTTTNTQRRTIEKMRLENKTGESLLYELHQGKAEMLNLAEKSKESISHDLEQRISQKQASTHLTSKGHFWETCYACLGTIIWAYGGIMFEYCCINSDWHW